MTYRRRIIGGALLAATLIGLPGCSMFKSMFYELQPYRLHRWNRSDALGDGSEAYYSVTDPIPPAKDVKTPAQSISDEN